MNLSTLLSDVQSIANVGQLALTLGEDAAPFIEQILDLVEGKQTLSDAQRQALLAKEAALRAQLQAPLPSAG